MVKTFSLLGKRKELRKKLREDKKTKRRAPSQKRDTEVESVGTTQQRDGRGESSLKRSKTGDGATMATMKRGKRAPLRSVQVNPEIAAEEREIERLSQLLGYANNEKDRKKVAAKLNKEYSMYEGVGDDFGDFLMDLDDLADEIVHGKDSKRKRDGDELDEDSPEEHLAMRSHILDDDEQEASDIEEDEDEGEDEEDEENEVREDRQAISHTTRDDNERDDDEEGEEEVEEDDDNEEEEEEEYDNDDDDGDDGEDGEDESNTAVAEAIYRPIQGEDIYGRSTTSAPGKYVPPAKRANYAVVDENSDAVKLVRRQMNGLLNRLSDQSKDSILRSIKDMFSSNSATVVSHVLRDCIMAACANPTQVMTSLIPVYASLVAALHLVVGIDVGAFIVESLTNSLFGSIAKAGSDKTPGGGVSALISDKVAGNCLLILVNFYNMRILHHHLIVDIMKRLSEDVIENRALESRAELLVCIVDHCGIQLRSDDPVGLREVVTALTASQQNKPEEGTRIQFLMETLTDLKNNRSKRTQSANAETVKRLRKWLGAVKSTFPSRHGGDLCLNVSLKDLLDAEKRGRWWRAGASWLGNESGENEGDTKAMSSSSSKSDLVTGASTEEQKLLAIASKMRFNTDARRNIFVVIMSSRDVNDAFERLNKLDLKGRLDREIVRVIVECCGQEKAYNAFYAELACLLCSQNRQYKTTLQFCFWDGFKDLSEGNFTDRRTMNMAHFLSHVVCAFHLPLSVIKPIDFTELSDSLVLFLATFFLAIFSSKIPEDTYISIFDRVATTKDFSAVRDLVLGFLQTHLVSIPHSHGLQPAQRKAVEKRRLKAIKLMNEMGVLDFASREED